MNDKQSRLRREQDIMERLENVKRLIQMEKTILTVNGAERFCRYCMVDREGKRIGRPSNDLLSQLRDEIQLQLLSIAALCYGSNPDIGEPVPMLEWNMSIEGDKHPEDKFREVWEECLIWNA